RLEASLQEVLRRGTGAAGDRTVDELDVGVLLVEDLDEGVEAELLEARGPPREDLDLLLAGGGRRRVDGRGRAVVRGRGTGARGEAECREIGRASCRERV